MICNRCGNQVPEGARFCNKCGGVISLPQSNTVPQPKNNKTIIISLLSIVVAFSLIAVVTIAVLSVKKQNTKKAILSETTENTTEAVTAIQLGDNDKEFIENELHAIFLNYLQEYDYNTDSVRDVITKFIIPIQDSPVYTNIYGTKDENGYKCLDWYEPKYNPDPLNLFDYGYEIYSKEKIDYILINVFNISEEAIKNTSIEDYIVQVDPSIVDMYYYNGFFYKEVGGYDNYGYFIITSISQSADGKYRIIVANYLDVDNEFNGNYEIIVEPKIINGEKHLAIYSSRRVG